MLSSKFQILCLLFPSIVFSQSKVVFPKTQNHFTVIAHRGNHSDVTENTVESLKKAIEIGVDYVEVDVRSTLEGVPVVMYDANVDRTTDGKGKLSEMSTVDFRNLKLKGTEINPPTLSTFLREASGKTNIYLNIIEADPEKIIAMLDKYQMKNNVVIYCSRSQIFQWKKLAPSIPIITSPPINIKTPVEFETFILSFPISVFDGTYQMYDAEITKKLTEINIPIWLNTMGIEDNSDTWSLAIKLGIKALQTDKPQELIKFLQINNIR